MKNRKPTIKSLQNRIKALEAQNRMLEENFQLAFSAASLIEKAAREKQDRARRMVEHFKEYSTTLLTTM